MLYPIWPELVDIILKCVLCFIFVSIILFFIHFEVRKNRAVVLIYNGLKNFFNNFFIWLVVICAFIFIVASFFAPNFLSIYPLEFNQSSSFATSINGLMSPFIAIAAAILTFSAFWVQYNANQNIHKENKKQQIERQFYEMLKIHRESVQNLEWKNLEAPTEYILCARKKINEKLCAVPTQYMIKNFDHVSYKGLHVIRKYYNELVIAFLTIIWHYSVSSSLYIFDNLSSVFETHLDFLMKKKNKKIFLVASSNILNTVVLNKKKWEKIYKLKIELIENEKAKNDEFWVYDEQKYDITYLPMLKDLFFKAYEIFFEGLVNVSLEDELKNTLLEIKDDVNRFDFKDYDSCNLPTYLKNKCRAQGRCNIFEGHRDVLNSYYRHLYFTVKNIEDSDVFNDDEKKKYIKILRSQMTSEEQALLLFNWYAGYGTEWECETKNVKNHFFTKNKIIHNVQLNDIEIIMNLSDWKCLFVGEFISEKKWNDMFEFVGRESKLKNN